MTKTKEELRELEAIVNLYKEQPDNLVNKIWSWRKKALQAKEEEVVEKYGEFRGVKGNKTGKTLRFYLLPHTKHKPEDSESEY